MRVLVSGAVAYDRIMDFPGRFTDHIIPEKIHQLNVSFNVETYRQEFGGTAGNIAYNLAQLGAEPRLVARYGSDFEVYQEWLHKNTIALRWSKPAKLPTAAAHIITDRADNQITGFFPGAMGQSYGAFPPALFSGVQLGIVSPGNVTDMQKLPGALHNHRVLYFYDPGQTIPVLSAAALKAGLAHALGLFANDYELSMILNKTGLTLSQLRKKLGMVIVTKGEQGSTIYIGRQQHRIPIVKPKRVIDPTGAGDAYRAGFLVGLLRGYPIDTLGRYAATVASYAVERYGTQVHTMTGPSVRKRYRAAFRQSLP